jgi:hypothetical protein
MPLADTELGGLKHPRLELLVGRTRLNTCEGLRLDGAPGVVVYNAAERGFSGVNAGCPSVAHRDGITSK